MSGSATYVQLLLFASSVLALCQGTAAITCEQFFSSNVGGHCAFFFCSTADQAVTCTYRNSTVKFWQLPQWYLNDEPLSPQSIAKYNDTVWSMVYDYSGLSPGGYVLHGKIEQEPGEMLLSCCGPLPEVFLNLTVDHEDELKDEQESVPESVVLQLGRSMKDLVFAIVKIVDEATGDDQEIS